MREQLALDGRFQPVGVGPERIGRTHELDGAQRVVQPPRREQGARAIHRRLGASRHGQWLGGNSRRDEPVLSAAAESGNPVRKLVP